MNRIGIILVNTALQTGVLMGAGDSLRTDFPMLNSVTARCKVTVSPLGRIFSYEYVFVAGTSNTGELSSIEIDISRGTNSTAFDTVGLQFDRPFIERSFRRNFPSRSGGIVPTSAAALPDRSWIAGLAVWNALILSTNITKPQAEDSIGVFRLASPGPPGIRTFTATPFFDQSEYFSPIDDPLLPENFNVDSAVTARDSIVKSLGYWGSTIGPVAPSTMITPIGWLDTLVSLKHQARDLGWIKEKGIVTSLDQKLENARQLLQRGSNHAAVNVLEAFIKEVEAQNEKGLTSEAYALLKYNAEYLIGKLREGK